MNNYTQEKMELDFKEAKQIVCNTGLDKCMSINYRLILVPKNYSLGKCKRIKENFYEIQLNQLYASTSTHESIINTLIHEILHSLPGGMRHTGAWKDYAFTIYNKTGIKIQRIGTKEECENYQKEKTLQTIEAHPDKVVYRISCKGCGANLGTKQRKTKAVKSIMEQPNLKRFYCPRCHSYELSVEFIPYASYMQKILTA